MPNSESIDSYVTHLQTIANEIQQNGKLVDDVRIVEKLLHTLSLKFDYVVAAIKEARDLSQIWIEDLVELFKLMKCG